MTTSSRRGVRVPALRRAALAAGSVALSGCFLWTSTEQGAEMRLREDALEARIAALETGAETVRTESAATSARVDEIAARTERATGVVVSTSADTGAEVERLAGLLSAQEGTIAELQHELSRLQTEYAEMEHDYEGRMKKLARRAGLDVELAEEEIPANADEHFRLAQAAFEERDFSTARALFRAFVTRHRDDARADDAQFFVGQSYLVEDRPATALGELRHVITDFGEADRVPYAIFAMSEAFWRLHACDEARSALEAIGRAHARSPVAAEARTRLRDYGRPPTGYCADAAATAGADAATKSR